MKIKVALLYGGASKEHSVSVMGYEYLYDILNKDKYDVVPVYIDRSGDWFVKKDGSDTPAFPSRNMCGGLNTGRGFVKIDVAIPLLHGDGGEDGTVQGALGCAGIKYVGADVSTSAVCLDKTYTKAIAKSLGIPVTDSVSFSRFCDTEKALSLCEDKIGFPMFIKPRRLGSSIGAYPVFTKEDFSISFPRALCEGGGLVIAEKLIENKRELECSFCEFDKRKIVTPPGEIITDGFYGYKEKYGGITKTAPVANVDESIRNTLIEYSHLLSDAVGLRHLGRIDFFLSDKDIYFNEINTFPGLTKESMYFKMLAAYGIDPSLAVDSFIKDAIGC